MKHSSTQELFKYWNLRRGRDLAPERDAIEPDAIRRILADTFILGFDARAEHQFRLAGTRVCAIFGRELRGEAFLRLWGSASQPSMRDLLTVLEDESIGIAAGATGHTADGAKLDLEMLVLPLKHRGRLDARALGAIVPVNAPSWFGHNPVIDLTLGPLRYVDPAVEAALPPPPSPRQALVPAHTERRSRRAARAATDAGHELPGVPPLSCAPGGRIRHGLIVYEGGLLE
jgi:hypothetical protein